MVNYSFFYLIKLGFGLMSVAGARPVAYNLVVAPDGSSQYKTIGEALAAVPNGQIKRTRIFINSGLGEVFPAEVARRKGAKAGLFGTRKTQTNNTGYADFDWFRVKPLRATSQAGVPARA